MKEAIDTLIKLREKIKSETWDTSLVKDGAVLGISLAIERLKREL